MRTAKCSQPEMLRRCPWSVLQWSLLMLCWCFRCSSENPLTFFLRFTSHALTLRAIPNLQTYLTKSCQRFGATWKFMQLMFTFNFEIKSFEVAWTTWLHDFSPPPFGFISYVAHAVFGDIEGSFGDLDTLVLWDGRFERLCWHDFAWQVQDFECLGVSFFVAAAVLLKMAESQITLARWRQLSLAPLFFLVSRLRTVLILISLVQPSAYFVHVGSFSSDAVLVFKSR